MEKLNDYFLNLLSNPTFSPSDFSLVGLSADNTSLQDKNVYLGIDAIKNNKLFLTNGEFDLSKFDEIYNVAKSSYNNFTNIKASEDLANTWKFYRGNIAAPKELRREGAEYTISKVQNPLRLQEGFVSFGLKENPTMSVREIAQTLKVNDNGKWMESPNETWFDNFINPKVLALWDEDGTHEDPITGEIVEHKKGEKKLNTNGTYYYETLNGRSPYGKEVLSGFDTLTTDGSTLNSLDFFDSDDIDKSIPGSIARAVTQIAPAFIPGLGEWYICSRVLLSMTELVPTIGKILSFDSENKLFSNIEAFNKAMSFSTSDYTQGSEEAGIQGRMWSAETGLKLIADVFTQLAEQRWIFKYGSSMLSGLKPKEISDPKAQLAWIENFIKDNSNNEALAKALKDSDLPTKLATIQSVNYARGKKALMDKLDGALKLGSKLSMAYMTGITTAGAYGEAKEAGASDIEAALFTLGYTAGEFALLNSDIGKWILPELKSEKRHWQAVVNKLREETKMIPKDNSMDKLKWYQKLYEIGKQVYHNDLGSNPVLGETLGSVVSNMLSEGIEETSEELLADLSKSLFTAAFNLAGSKTDLKPFENVFDRYAMSFLGGSFGGGIAGALPSYRAARYHNSMDGKVAAKELVDIILLGKEKEFLETAYKMNLSDKHLANEVDEQGNYKEGTPNNNRDLDVKRQLTNLVYNIKDILTANGADMSRNEIVNSLKGELRYAQLTNLASQNGNAIWYYLNRYNELSTQLATETLNLYNLENLPEKTDKEKRNESENSSANENLKEQIKLKKELIQNIKDELEAYRDGRMSDEFIQDALFEMITGISSFYLPTDVWRWMEEKEGKSYLDIPKDRKAELIKEYEEIRKNITQRELLHKARQVHILNQEYLADVIDNFNETYFKNRDAVINNIEEILFGEKRKLTETNATERTEQYLHIYDNVINPLLFNIQRQLILGLDKTLSEIVKQRLNALDNMKGSIAEILGRDLMPTLEELKSMSGEDLQKIVEAILENVNINGQVISDLSVDNLDTYEQDLKEADTNLLIARTQAFNLQFMEFLQNPEIKNVIIGKLKSAPYLLPTTKLALQDFFKASVKVTNEYGEISEIKLNDSDLNDYLSALENISSSPIDEYLTNVVMTLRSKGIDVPKISGGLAKLVSDLAKVGNLESFNYDSDTEELIKAALDIINLGLVGIESAKTSITGDLNDLFGFNATVNEIREKRNTQTRNNKATEETKSKPRKLALINSDIATLIQLDLNRYREELLSYLKIYASNTNSVLSTHDNTQKIESYFLYDRVKRFIGSTEIDDWKGIDEIRNLLETTDVSEIFNKIKENRTLKVNDDIKNQITKSRTLFESALYKFFKDNLDKINDKEQLKKLLKNISPSIKESNWVLNEIEEGIPEADFVWYLASLAAVDPQSVLHEYKNSISGNFAPIAGQEEAIRTTYSFLLNPKVFEKFAEAYNENLPEKVDLKQIPYLNINTFRSIFIEGMAGTGKSTATMSVLLRMLDLYHPSVLKNLVLVSNSTENTQLLLDNLRKSTGLKLENVQIFSKSDYFKKISNNYPNIEDLFDDNGLMKITRDDITYDENGNPIYSKITPNSNGLNASLVIIDEATSLSLQDAMLEEEWLKTKGIYSIKAGDFDLLGVYGEYTNDAGQGVPVFQVGTNYIRTHKLGQIIRGNNEYKINNILTLKTKNKELVNVLTGIEPSREVFKTSYYMDNTGIYGDVVDSNENGQISDATKLKIDLMLSTLNKEEKLNFIFDDKSSVLYLYLEGLNISGKYSDKIEFVTAGASQSLEGQYYIVDLKLPQGLLASNDQDILKAQRAISSLYTAMTRAKQATLIFDRVNPLVDGENIILKISSVRMDKLVMKKMSDEVIKNYGDLRIKVLENNLGEYKKSPEPDWKPTESKLPDTSEESNSNNEGNGPETDEDVDINNTPEKSPDIINDTEGVTNMMLHSVMVQETGCEVSNPDLDPTDPNNKLRMSQHSDKRIDNINGLVRIKSLGITPESDGTLSQENKEKALKILGLIRNSAIYRKSKDEIINDVATALDIVDTSNIKVNFIYKNAFELDTLNSGDKRVMKFFKSVKEKLLGIFNKDGNREKLTSPHRQTIGLEIFINEEVLNDDKTPKLDSEGHPVRKWKLKLEVPVVMFTSPLTMLNTKGYEDLKQVFEGITLNRGESRVYKFKEWLWQHYNDPTAPAHTKSMYKMIELYTNYKNFVVRFNDDFVLNGNNSRISGIIHALKRGEDYFFTNDYDYYGKPVSLKEYRERMSWRNISDIRVNNSKQDIVVNGQIIAKSGNPFVLISDAPELRNASAEELMELYIKQAEDSSELKKVKRMYLYAPKGTVEDFLYNMDRAIKKTGENFTTEDIDTNLGNKLSTYRLLSFIAVNGSNFDLNFEIWTNNISTAVLEDKDNALERWNNLKSLISKIKEIERGFSLTNGTKANQLLNLLDKDIENLPKELKNIALNFNHPKLPFNTPLRTILLYEFRKLLYSASIYGPSLSLQTEDISIERNPDGTVKFKDFQKPKVESLIKDAEHNGFDGIQYYTPLMSADYNISVKGFTFAKVNAEDDTKISKRSYEINGKLETSAVVTDIEPILNEIIKKGIPMKDSTEGRSRLNNYSEEENVRLYEQNLLAYLNGTIAVRIKTPVEIFNENLVGSISFGSTINNSDKFKIKSLIKSSEVLNDVHLYLCDKLIGQNYFPVKTNAGKYLIVKLPNVKSFLIYSEKLILLLDNDGHLSILDSKGKVNSIENNELELQRAANITTNSEILVLAAEKLLKLLTPIQPIEVVLPQEFYPDAVYTWEDVLSNIDIILNDTSMHSLLFEDINGNGRESLNVAKLIEFILTNNITDINDLTALATVLSITDFLKLKQFANNLQNSIESNNGCPVHINLGIPFQKLI